MCIGSIGIVEGDFIGERRAWFAQEVGLEGADVQRDFPAGMNWHFREAGAWILTAESSIEIKEIY